MQQPLFPYSSEDAEEDARKILEATISRHSPSHVFGLFSGGHDSLCAVHLASRHPAFTACVHVNTEIGIEKTREFARDTCQSYGWPLIELRPPRPPFRKKDGTPWGLEGQTAYEAMVMRWGFPGPLGHSIMYQRLKERCLAKLIRENRQGKKKIVLVTGVRKQESRRRMGHIVAEQVEGRRVWCAPLMDWEQSHKEAYILKHGLPVNQVAKRLCMSGECLCGAYAHEGELAEVRAVSPETHEYIRSLEGMARDAGVARCKWGDKTPMAASKPGNSKQKWLPLCHGCEGKWDEKESK